MGQHRFDTLVKQLDALTCRRTWVRFFLTGLVTGPLGLTTATDLPGLASPNATLAVKRQRRKKKNAKKKQRKEKKAPCGVECRKVGETCSPIVDPGPQCCAAGACCGCLVVESCLAPAKLECLDPVLPGPRCCRNAGFSCTADCDCCGLNACVDGRCAAPECKELKEKCVFATDCCDGGEVDKPFTCQNNFSACPGLPDRYCCALANFGADSACTDDCDCCGTVLCLDGFCGGP